MNYLILGRGANTGDLGIAAATIQEIRRIDADAAIVYLCDRPKAFSTLTDLQGCDVDLFRDISQGPSTSSASRYLPRGAGFAMRLFALRWRPSLLFRREPELRRIAEHHSWADIVVRQGGPGWNDWVLHRKILKIRLAYFLLARHYRLPIVKYAQSFGPFLFTGSAGRLKKSVVRYLLNGAQLLTLRDRYSRSALESIGVSIPEIVDAADVAWNLQQGSRLDASRTFRRYGINDREQPWIGLTLRSMGGRYGVSEEREQELFREFAVFCDAVVERLGTLIFLSTDYRASGHRNDLDAMRLVQDQMRYGARVKVIEDEMTPDALKAMYAEMDVLVSMRLHPAIFAMSTGVPTFLIGYDPKCADAAAQMRMCEWYADVKDFSAPAAIERIEEMLSRKAELSEITARRAAEIKAHARRSADALQALVRR